MSALKCFLLFTIPYWIDFLMMLKHCTGGFMGYPDEWDNKKQEKIHDILAPASVLSVAIGIVIAMVIL